MALSRCRASRTSLMKPREWRHCLTPWGLVTRTLLRGEAIIVHQTAALPALRSGSFSESESPDASGQPAPDATQPGRPHLYGAQPSTKAFRWSAPALTTPCESSILTRLEH